MLLSSKSLTTIIGFTTVALISFPFIAKDSCLLSAIKISVLTGREYDLISSGVKLLTRV